MMTHQKNENLYFMLFEKLWYLELFTQIFWFFHTLEVLESECLNSSKKFTITEVCLRYAYVVSYFVPIKAPQYHVCIVWHNSNC